MGKLGKKMKRIFCLGDSHINHFPYLQGYDVIKQPFGPITVSGISLHIDRILDYVKNSGFPTEKQYVTLSIGEIDCRVHIGMNADKLQKDEKEIIADQTESLIECYNMLNSLGAMPIVSGVHPCLRDIPTLTLESSIDYNNLCIYGNRERRHTICTEWNKQLEEKAVSAGFKYYDIYSSVINENNAPIDMYYTDFLHLDYKIIHPIISEKLLKILEQK